MKHLKQEFDKLTFKETLCYILAFSSITAGFVMIFMGMFMPPEGEIHDSVLYAFALILLFVGALLGIDMKYEASRDKFKSEILSFIKDLNLPNLNESKPQSQEPDSAPPSGSATGG